jgi:hypothetical protein
VKQIDPVVQKFFSSALGKITKQAREIEKSAERVFRQAK